MAGPNMNNQPQYNYLSSNQQDLLLAALSSNGAGGKQSPFQNAKGSMSNGQQQLTDTPLSNAASSLYASPQQGNSLTDFDAFNVDNSPYMDGFLDADGTFDFDVNGQEGQMFGDLPGASSTPDLNGEDAGDKRKSFDDDDEDDFEGGGKRQEGEDKQAKKPGRKPLTSEPTTVCMGCIYSDYNTNVQQKRKAQNRAAQRAFRERKEKHLKDLESKVGELEQASEAANHENGLLRAQVERLQTELREYRKRLSLNSSGLKSSPPLSNGRSSYLTGTSSQNVVNGSANNFQFDFPRFGGLPGAHIFNNGMLAKTEKPTLSPRNSTSNTAPGVLSRHDSNGRSMSPKSQTNGSIPIATSKRQNSSGSSQSSFLSSDPLSGLFNDPLLNGTSSNSTMGQGNSNSQDSRRNNDSTMDKSRVFQFNSNSTPSNSGSPSESSASRYGATSSCGTSPEPSHNSPNNGAKDCTLDTVNEELGYVCHGNSEGEVSFCEKLNMACGNPRNPVPRAMSVSNGTPAPAATATISTTTNVAAPNSSNHVNGIDWLSNQNGGQFDPLLFGDYRDSQAAIVGDGDFTGGFFNDAFSMPDLGNVGSPFNFGDRSTPAPTSKPNPIEAMEKLQDGLDDDEVVPADDRSQMMSCHNIWYVLGAQCRAPPLFSLTVITGTNCRTIRTSRRANLISTIFARSSAPKPAAPKAAWLWIRRMSTLRSSACPKQNRKNRLRKRRPRRKGLR